MKQLPDEVYRELARDQYATDDGAVSIDNNAVVNPDGESGAYVQAWVWVANVTWRDNRPSETGLSETGLALERTRDLYSEG